MRNILVFIGFFLFISPVLAQLACILTSNDNNIFENDLTAYITSISPDIIEINGENVSQGDTVVFEGINVTFNTLAYHSLAPELSRVVLDVDYPSSFKNFAKGDTIIVEDEEISIGEIFNNIVEINGENVSDGKSKTIGDVTLNDINVGYHSLAPELSKVIFDISVSFLLKCEESLGESDEKIINSDEVGIDEITEEEIYNITENNNDSVSKNKEESSDVVFSSSQEIVKNNICEEGCYIGGNCYPVGYREDGEYCSKEGDPSMQLQIGDNCSDDFECATNICSNDGLCEDKGIFKGIVDWFKDLFN